MRRGAGEAWREEALAARQRQEEELVSGAPEIDPHSARLAARYGASFEERQASFEARKEAKLRELERARQRAEVEGASFQPEINPVSRRISARRGADSCLAWAEARDARRAAQQQVEAEKKVQAYQPPPMSAGSARILEARIRKARSRIEQQRTSVGEHGDGTPINEPVEDRLIRSSIFAAQKRQEAALAEERRLRARAARPVAARGLDAPASHHLAARLPPPLSPTDRDSLFRSLAAEAPRRERRELRLLISELETALQRPDVRRLSNKRRSQRDGIASANAVLAESAQRLDLSSSSGLAGSGLAAASGHDQTQGDALQAGFAGLLDAFLR
jgi:hypothetical protein